MFLHVMHRPTEGQGAQPRSGCATCWAVWGGEAMHRPSGMRSCTSCTVTTSARNEAPGWRCASGLFSLHALDLMPVLCAQWRGDITAAASNQTTPLTASIECACALCVCLNCMTQTPLSLVRCCPRCVTLLYIVPFKVKLLQWLPSFV